MMQCIGPKSTLEAATARNNLPADAQADLAEEKTTKPKQPNALDRYAVPQSTLEDATKIKTTCILHRVARRKDATFFFGPPGAAKTLLAVGLLIKSSELGQIDPESVYYINADDNQQGLSTKNKIFSEYGIKMLAPMHQGFDERQLPRLLYDLIDSGHAADTTILLDTGKKFYDPMSKESCRSFMTSVRHFVGAGGSVIILAHTNKWTRSDGSLIPGGTSDVLDDCDAAYTLRTISGSADSEEKAVLIECIKNRGGPSGPFCYSYRTEGTYQDVLASICEVDPPEHGGPDSGDRSDEKRRVNIIKGLIWDKTDTKMELRDAVAQVAKISKLQALKTIERYTGTDPTRHHWRVEVGRHGANKYILLDEGSTDDSGVY